MTSNTRRRLCVGLGVIFSLAVFSTARAASVCGSISGNLVTNCGFESDPGGTNVPTGWAVTDGPFGFTNGASAHSGTWGYFLDQARRADPLVISQSIVTTPGDLYQVSFWLTTGLDPLGRDTVDVTFGGVSIFSEVSDATSDNHFVEHSFILLAASGSTDLAFAALNHSGVQSLDDVSVTDLGAAPTPIPATLPLFASGAGVFGFLGWRRKRKAVTKQSLAAVLACLAMSGGAKASVYDFTFTSTIINATTPIIVVGDTFTINLLLDNGGSTLVSQTWSSADAISGFTIDTGSYHGSYSTLFPGSSFQTDVSGALTLTNFFGAANTSNNQDNFGSFGGNVLSGNRFLDFFGRSNFYAALPTTVADWTVSAATPLPAALPLFATGLGALGLHGWRRKRKIAAKAA